MVPASSLIKTVIIFTELLWIPLDQCQVTTLQWKNYVHPINKSHSVGNNIKDKYEISNSIILVLPPPRFLPFLLKTLDEPILSSHDSFSKGHIQNT